MRGAVFGCGGGVCVYPAGRAAIDTTHGARRRIDRRRSPRHQPTSDAEHRVITMSTLHTNMYPLQPEPDS